MTQTDARRQEIRAERRAMMECLEIECRKVGPDFADALAQLWRQTFCQAYAGVHSETELQAYCDANFTRDTAQACLTGDVNHCEVAFKGDTAQGYFWVNHTDCPHPLPEPSSELKRIYVLSYGSGVGPALFERAIAAVRAAGRSHVWLAVSDINYRAQAFYRKLGFQPVGIGPTFQVGDKPVTSRIMALAI